jgi:biopolymer transport protein ExbD
MAAIKGHGLQLEADMVPYIDIVTLLMMFLIVVGDMTAKVNTVMMRLPRVSEAKSDKEFKTERRLVIQMYKDDAGRYWAVVESRKYELTHRAEGSSLVKYLEDQVQRRISLNEATKNERGEVNFPVKLRVPYDAPMEQVERVLFSLARVGLSNLHLAAEPGPARPARPSLFE